MKVALILTSYMKRVSEPGKPIKSMGAFGFALVVPITEITLRNVFVYFYFGRLFFQL